MTYNECFIYHILTVGSNNNLCGMAKKITDLTTHMDFFLWQIIKDTPSFNITEKYF